VVIVLGSIQIDPEQRDELIASQSDEAASSRAEPGCIEWTMLTDPEHPDVIRILEVWADPASFDAHLAVLAMRRAGVEPPPSAAAVRETQLTRYDVASSARMG
jgi:quinol monooxygenase YgiN